MGSSACERQDGALVMEKPELVRGFEQWFRTNVKQQRKNGSNYGDICWPVFAMASDWNNKKARQMLV